MIKGHLITGLDIGTNSVKVLTVVFHPETKELEIVGQAQVANAGMRKGVVVNPDLVAGQIQEALGQVQPGLEKNVRRVWVGLGGSHLVFLGSRGLVQVSRADQKISEADVERALQASRTVSLSPNQEILDVFPQEYVVDGQAGVKEALGLRGIRLEAKTLCLAVFSPYLKNLTEAVLAAGLEIEDVRPAGLAAAHAVLTPAEKELGVAFLEMGAGTTFLAVFQEGVLSHAAVFPVGANNVTNDLAVVLKTEVEKAEEIKKEFSRGEKIDQRKVVAKVTEARVKEILNQVYKELKAADKTKLPGGVVLSGGGANFDRLTDLAKKELRLTCRLGSSRGLEASLEDPAWNVAAGLVREAADALEQEDNLSFAEKGILGKIKNLVKNFVP